METEVQTCYLHPDRQAGIVCQRCDRPICPSCMHQASVGFHCPECTKVGAQKVYQGIGSLRQKPVVTQALVAINLVVFVLTVIIGGATALQGSTSQLQVDLGLMAKLWERPDGLFYGPVPGSEMIGVGAGQVYRLVTSGFLHFGLMHIAFNMYALWILGQAVETAAGRLRFGLIYTVAVLGGSLGALVLDPQAITAGASGGVFGLMGALFLAHRAMGIPFRNSPLITILVLNLFITFAVPGISAGGHVGGLIGGALAGWLVFDVGRRPGIDARLPAVLCGALAVSLLVAGIVVASSFQPTL